MIHASSLEFSLIWFNFVSYTKLCLLKLPLKINFNIVTMCRFYLSIYVMNALAWRDCHCRYIHLIQSDFYSIVPFLIWLHSLCVPFLPRKFFVLYFYGNICFFPLFCHIGVQLEVQFNTFD